VSTWSERRPGRADILTLGNALCGAAAMLVVSGTGPLPALTADERYQAAVLLLLLGTCLDVLDGAAARRWGGTALGGPLDCLADGITFGVAPVVAVAAYVSSGGFGGEQIALAAGALLYVAAALLRLADFMTAERDTSDFVGLPTTSACVAALCLGYLSPPPVVVAIGLVGLAVMMVSPLAYPTGARVVALLVVGWGVGLVGVVGLVDVRVPAVLSMLTIVVVVPMTSHLHARAVSGSASA
jgi:CDP-diacylglycerol--serine O-phosphatidyltransferase